MSRVEQNELLELVAEELGPRAGIIEGEGRERIEHPVLSR